MLGEIILLLAFYGYQNRTKRQCRRSERKWEIKIAARRHKRLVASKMGS
jgi:hypothetical protein